MRSYDESTEVGFRIRGIEPSDLAGQPESVRLMFWNWVVDAALKRKDYELSKGWDKDGQPLRPLTAKSIKNRKSEVGPTDKTAPPLEPSWSRSRVRSLLTGRAHVNSCELWWGFDSHSGRSFAYVLRAQREQGRDVFGLSDRGIGVVRAQAWDKWDRWKRGQHPEKPATKPPMGKQLPRYAKQREIKGRMDLENMDLAGNEAEIRTAMGAKLFPGFRILNARGQRWKPGSGLEGKGPTTPPAPQPAPRPNPKPLTFGLSPARIILDPDNRPAILKAIKKALGPNATPQTVATLAGAPKDTTANIFVSGFANENLTVYVSAPGIDIKREIVRARIGADDWIIRNLNVFLDDELQGHGLGTEILGRQIESASKAGIKYLRTEAAGSINDESRVGYKVWPKLGYEGFIPRDVLAKLPPEFAGMTKISELYVTQAGRDWWEQNGETVMLSFDLTPGSYSMRVWNAYLDERRRQGRTP